MTPDAFAPRPAMFRMPPRLVPSAWAGHVPFGAWLISVHKPRTLVELGTHFGMSYASFCQTVQSEGLDTRCYAVDSWQGDAHAGFYGQDVFDDLNAFNERHFSGFSQLMRMDFDQAAEHFADGSIDLLHIDGLHTYEAVRHDFEHWRAKLSERAIVLFHDTHVRERDFGVWKYWAEVKAQYPSFEFDHSAGLGVLAVGALQPPEVLRLLAASSAPSMAREIKEIFASLGDAVQRRYELAHAQDTLRSRDGDIHRVLKQLAQGQDELDALREKHLSAVRLLQERHDEQQRQAHALVHCTETLVRTQAQLTQARDDLQRIRESASWRLTRPLRALRQLFPIAGPK